MCRFDAEVSERRKARIMRRYKRLVQRHLHALPQGHGLRFLAKNPLMASKSGAVDGFSRCTRGRHRPRSTTGAAVK